MSNGEKERKYEFIRSFASFSVENALKYAEIDHGNFYAKRPISKERLDKAIEYIEKFWEDAYEILKEKREP